MNDEMDKKTIEKTEDIDKKRISVFRSTLFNKIYATNVNITSTDVDFRVELFNEKFKIETGWVYQSDGLLILTKTAAKKLLITLDEKIKSYEKENGEIKVEDEGMELQYSI